MFTRILVLISCVVVTEGSIECQTGCIVQNGHCAGCKEGYYRTGTYCLVDEWKCHGLRKLFNEYECEEGLGNLACFNLGLQFGYSCIGNSLTTNYMWTCISCKDICEQCAIMECMERIYLVTEVYVKPCLNSSVYCAYACANCEEKCQRGLHPKSGGGLVINSCQTCSEFCAAGDCNAMTGNCNRGCVGSKYWGKRCDKTCHENCTQCDQITGYCLGCIAKSMFGIACEHICSNGCLNDTCNTEDGKCTSGCKDGFYGASCGLPCHSIDPGCNICKTNTLGSYAGCSKCKQGMHSSLNVTASLNYCIECSRNCKNGNCSSFTGNCQSGCVEQSWGSQCERPCPENCSVCDQDHGKCLHCSHGKTYGEECEHICHTNCSNDTCHTKNGTCLWGCKDGFYGNECEFPCQGINSGCIKCTTNANGSYGGCTECNHGFYRTILVSGLASYCTECSFNCEQKQCSVNSGSCLKGCVNAKWWGDRCERACKEICLECEKNTGVCLICNITDVYEGNCEMPCSDNCLNETCHTDNRTCPLGCKDGFYGETCDLTCSKHCQNSVCDRYSGYCDQVCEPGVEGLNCLQKGETSGSVDNIPEAIYEELPEDLDANDITYIRPINDSDADVENQTTLEFEQPQSQGDIESLPGTDSQQNPSSVIYHQLQFDVTDEAFYYTEQVNVKQSDLS